MNRATGTTMKPIMSASAFRLDSGYSTPCVSSWPFCAVIMYVCIRTSMCGIISTIFSNKCEPGNGATTAVAP